MFVKYLYVICLLFAIFCTLQVSSQRIIIIGRARAIQARAVIGNGNATGTITISETYYGLHYKGTISGLTPGLHGFHVHENGNIVGGCASAGAHFNPFNKTHGAATGTNRHVGDLGNIQALNNGVANVFIIDRFTSLRGANTILNRSIVVHQDRDDLGRGGFPDSLTTGHSGARVGCGPIREI